MSGFGMQAPKDWSNPLQGIGGVPFTPQYSLSGSSNLGQIGVGGTGLKLDGGTTGLTSAGLDPKSFWGGGDNMKLGDMSGAAGGSGFGFNLGTLNMGVNGLAAIGGLYSAFQSNKLARDQFNFQKEFANTNLNNQIKTYNTTLEDRAVARARLDGREDQASYAADYVDKNKLNRG